MMRPIGFLRMAIYRLQPTKYTERKPKEHKPYSQLKTAWKEVSQGRLILGGW